jgi:hypothetical protein
MKIAMRSASQLLLKDEEDILNPSEEKIDFGTAHPKFSRTQIAILC